jgi:integrase/recombinase XerD
VKVNEAARAFLTNCKSVRKLSQHTVRAYDLDLRHFAEFAGAETSLETCDPDRLYAYVRYLFEERHLSEASVRRHVATLSALFQFTRLATPALSDPFRTARIRIRTARRLPRIVPRAELRLLLQEGRRRQGSGFGDLTAYVAVELLFATGMRVSELAGLADCAVELDDGVITIIGKGDRQRRVFIPVAIAPLLRRYRRQRQRHSPAAETFLVNARGGAASAQCIRRRIRTLAGGLALQRTVTPHMLRHSVATYLLEEGVDIRYVQRLLGHRSITTTEIYTHVADASLRQRITERHPRRSLLR